MFQNHDSAELFVDLSLFRNEIIKCRLYDYSCQIKILMSQIVASRKFSLRQVKEIQAEAWQGIISIS